MNGSFQHDFSIKPIFNHIVNNVCEYFQRFICLLKYGSSFRFDKALLVLSYSITIIQVIPRYSILGMYVIPYFFSCPGAHFPMWRLEISSVKTGSLFPEFGQKDDDDNNNNNDIKTV